MRIAHISDTHGGFPTLPKNVDIVVHSGDFIPNGRYLTLNSRVNLEMELNIQAQWLERKGRKIREWLGGRKFLFCCGNHDFVCPVEIMQSFGIDAHSITEKEYTFEEKTFYGFPYIPYIDGMWNFERTAFEMSKEAETLRETLKHIPVDILVSHCPPHGVLDYVVNMYGDRHHLGNTFMASMFSWDTDVPKPKTLLCGHVHESHGVQYAFDMLVSNAATVVNIINIEAVELIQ